MSNAAIPGAVIVRVNRGASWALRVPPGQRRALPWGCEPDVYLDGVLQRDRFNPPPGHPRLLDVNVVSPSIVEGIEVYTGATAPEHFASNGCGMILIWTRR